MQKIVMTGLLIACLMGCTTVPYGNYAAISINQQQQMAAETIKQLVSLCPPAKTRFNVLQPTFDAYGTTLIQAMREKGYALQEYSLQGKSDTTKQAVSGLNFQYVIDSLASTNLYRVTVIIGAQSLSCVFTFTTDDKLYPIGPWVRKES